MTDPQRLIELAEQCEQAKVREQRALLKLAYEAVFGGPECTLIDRWPGYSSPRWDRFHAMLNAEAYESAAMMLVPEGWVRRIGVVRFGMWQVELWHGDKSFRSLIDMSALAITPALALAAAALRALASKEQAGGQ